MITFVEEALKIAHLSLLGRLSISWLFILVVYPSGSDFCWVPSTNLSWRLWSCCCGPPSSFLAFSSAIQVQWAGANVE